MFDDTKIKTLDTTFKRIFALPITRSTFREMQNAIFAVSDGDADSSNSLFESLLTGEVKKENDKHDKSGKLKNFIEQFTIFARVARDVFERGEFISLASSDILRQQNRVVLLNRLRRVDGEELQFLTDAEGTLRLLQHFAGRLNELKGTDLGAQQIKALNETIAGVRDSVQRLLS